MASYFNNPNARIILAAARKHGSDPYTLLATAIKESSLNTKAVGDGGTSFGLFQMHVGGAGGATQASARRYFDPRLAADNRARNFKGGRGGAWAASVQRPADKAGYARDVDRIIAQLKKQGGLPAGGAKAGRVAPAQTAATTGGDPARKEAALAMIFDGPNDGVFREALARRNATQAAAPPVAAPARARGRSGTANGMSAKGAPPRKPGEADWQYIQRLGMQMFGLRNDAGTSQLYGGRHSAGSEHGWDKPNPRKQGRAVDFGTAKNSRPALNAWKAWAKRAGFDVLDEGDHIHTSSPGGGI